MSKPPEYRMRVQKGSLVPADMTTIGLLRERDFKNDMLVRVIIKKDRNPKYNSLIHVGLGNIFAQNLDCCTGMTPHRAIKYLQAESGCGCEMDYARINDMIIELPRPRSLSFTSMDQSEYEETVLGICRHVAEKYWSQMTAQQIFDMEEMPS